MLSIIAINFRVQHSCRKYLPIDLYAIRFTLVGLCECQTILQHLLNRFRFDLYAQAFWPIRQGLAKRPKIAFCNKNIDQLTSNVWRICTNLWAGPVVHSVLAKWARKLNFMANQVCLAHCTNISF